MTRHTLHVFSTPAGSTSLGSSYLLASHASEISVDSAQAAVSLLSVVVGYKSGVSK